MFYRWEKHLVQVVNQFQDLDLHVVSTPHLARGLKEPLELLRQEQIEEILQEVLSFMIIINCDIDLIKTRDFESSYLHFTFYQF